MPTRHSLLSPLLPYVGPGIARTAGGATPAAVSTALLDVLRKVLEEAGIAAPDGVANDQATRPVDDPAASAAVAAPVMRETHGLPGSGNAFSDTVARVREELVRREHATRSEHLALDKALAGLSSGSATQSETVILCEQGGQSGGRVYVSNPTSSSVLVHLRIHAVDHEHVDAAIRAEPPELAMAPGAILPVRVAVDLSVCDQFTGALQRRLAFMNGDQCLGICWLTIRVPPR